MQPRSGAWRARDVGFVIAGSSLVGVVLGVGCFTNAASSGSGGGSSGGASNGGASSVVQTASGSGSAGIGGAGPGGAGGSVVVVAASSSGVIASSSGTGGGTTTTTSTGPSLACAGIPATPPSNGSCVGFGSDAGVELDAGLDDAGNASQSTCNPVTFAGCTGTDICQPDDSRQHYYCRPAGPTTGVAPCQSCANGESCAVGGLCVGSSTSPARCMQMCCTDADCGGSGQCDPTFLTPALRFGVGICVMN